MVDECYSRRFDDQCPHESTLNDLHKQSARIDRFIEDAEPLMGYVRAEMARNNKRAEFYEKISEHVLGAGIIAIFALVGHWVINHLKMSFGVGK